MYTRKWIAWLCIMMLTLTSCSVTPKVPPDNQGDNPSGSQPKTNSEKQDWDIEKKNTNPSNRYDLQVACNWGDNTILLHVSDNGESAIVQRDAKGRQTILYRAEEQIYGFFLLDEKTLIFRTAQTYKGFDLVENHVTSVDEWLPVVQNTGLQNIYATQSGAVALLWEALEGAYEYVIHLYFQPAGKSYELVAEHVNLVSVTDSRILYTTYEDYDVHFFDMVTMQPGIAKRSDQEVCKLMGEWIQYEYILNDIPVLYHVYTGKSISCKLSAKEATQVKWESAVIDDHNLYCGTSENFYKISCQNGEIISILEDTDIRHVSVLQHEIYLLTDEHELYCLKNGDKKAQKIFFEDLD
jgi:hypothetical protein